MTSSCFDLQSIETTLNKATALLSALAGLAKPLIIPKTISNLIFFFSAFFDHNEKVNQTKPIMFIDQDSEPLILEGHPSYGLKFSSPGSDVSFDNQVRNHA